MTLRYTRRLPDTTPPMRGTEHSAGLDLTVDEPVVIPAGQTRMVTTGVGMAIPTGMVGKVYVRSSVGAKLGVVLANGTGIIDADYRGEIMLSLHNISDRRVEFARGNRIAQIVIQRYEHLNPMEVTNLDTTTRGTNGFGSTGTSALA